MYKLPVDYTKLKIHEKAIVREQYIKEQNGKCMYCGESLKKPAPDYITNKYIDWDLFPENFLKSPIHLQHNHNTGMTEELFIIIGNAVMWQYEHR